MPGPPDDFKDRITLQRIQGADDGTFQDLPSGQIPQRWAAVEWQGDGRARIRIRYDATNGPKSLRDTDPGMRVLFGAHVLDVEDVVEAVPRQEVYLFARDVVVDSANLSTGGHRVVAG